MAPDKCLQPCDGRGGQSDDNGRVTSALSNVWNVWMNQKHRDRQGVRLHLFFGSKEEPKTS